MINNSRFESFDLRNKNVLLIIIIDMTNHVSDDENNFHYILNSQFKDQESLSNINTNFNNIINENNDALNDFTSSNENRYFKNLILI